MALRKCVLVGILLCVVVILASAIGVLRRVNYSVQNGVIYRPTLAQETSGQCCDALSPWRCVSVDGGGGARAAGGAPSRPLRIGFVTTATASARGMVQNLWRSIQEHAFPGHEVHMYVLSDVVDSPEYAGLQRLHVRPLVAMEPPFDVLGLHAVYLSNFDWFTGLNYVFAVDARAAIVATLDDSMLGERVATLSPRRGYSGREMPDRDSRLSYDFRPFSSAHVAAWEGACSFAGGLFGGTLGGFAEMLARMVQLVKTDMGAMPPRAALRLDEGYLNRVLIDLLPTVVLADAFVTVATAPRQPAAAGPGAVSRAVRGADGGGRGGLDGVAPLARGGVEHGSAEPRSVRIPELLLRFPGSPRWLKLPFAPVHRAPGVTFVVRAFQRPRCIRGLLRMLSVRYPGASVIILDDSRSTLLPDDDAGATTQLKVTYVRAEYNVGLSEARNRLLRLVDSAYVVFLTDNMLVDAASDVHHLVGVLEANGADIVGGCVTGTAYGAHRFAIFGGVLHETTEVQCTHSLDGLLEDFSRTPEFSTPDISCWQVDLPGEFFVARVSALRKLQWDTRIGLRGHEDLFLQAKAANVRVSMCLGVSVRLNLACTRVDARSDLGPADVEPDEWLNLMTKWKFTEIRLPTATVKLKCKDNDACASTTSDRVARAVVPPEVPATESVCCGHDSPWVCATGGRPVGNMDAVMKVSRYRRFKIGFVTYATGPYNAFVRDLWASIQEHAFTRHDVHLFVFTDNTESYDGQKNVHTLLQKRVGWPFDSLGRHFLFLDHIDWFSGVDYIFSVDSDAVVVGTLDESMLGERVACLNAWYFGLQRRDYTYETRLTPAGTRLSKGYIDASEGQCYFAGGMFGGSVRGFREILEGTVRLARSDLNARPSRVAIWHDESYLNRVFLDAPPTVVLAPNYMYPEPPVDAWLYVQAPSAARAWYMPQNMIRRFSPRVLNLGVRKHVDQNAAVYQPLSAVIPAFMTSSGVPGTLHLPLVTGQRLDELTFIVKAFERPDCLRRLLKSIGDIYRGANVIVLDDSRKALLPKDESSVLAQRHHISLTYVRTAFDIGLAAARNSLVDLVRTPFAALLDDDSILDGTENVMHLVTALEAGGFDIAGGCVQSPKYGPGCSYSLARSSDRLEIAPDVVCAAGEPASRPPDFDTAEVACWKSDLILNFFVGRVKALRDRVRWDPRLKLGVHEDFFLRAQQDGLSVALCRGITVVNDHSCDASVVYANGRAHEFDNWEMFFETWSLREMETATGLYRLKCEAAGGTGDVALARRGCEVLRVITNASSSGDAA